MFRKRTLKPQAVSCSSMDWVLSLGMHNLREAERGLGATETRQSRRAEVGKGLVVRTLVKSKMGVFSKAVRRDERLIQVVRGGKPRARGPIVQKGDGYQGNLGRPQRRPVGADPGKGDAGSRLGQFRGHPFQSGPGRASQRTLVRPGVKTRKVVNVKCTCGYDHKDVGAPLPFMVPRRAAHRRRLRRKVLRRTPALVLKNPVKVGSVAEGVSRRTVVNDLGFDPKNPPKFVPYDRKTRGPITEDTNIMDKCYGCSGNGHFHHKDCTDSRLPDGYLDQYNVQMGKWIFRPIEECVFDPRCVVSREKRVRQSRDRRRAEQVRENPRGSGTRRQKRRNWFTNVVVKKLSKYRKGEISKKRYREVLVRTMKEQAAARRIRRKDACRKVHWSLDDFARSYTFTRPKLVGSLSHLSPLYSVRELKLLNAVGTTPGRSVSFGSKSGISF